MSYAFLLHGLSLCKVLCVKTGSSQKAGPLYFSFSRFSVVTRKEIHVIDALICYCFASLLLVVHTRGYNEFVYVNITIQVQERMRGN